VQHVQQQPCQAPDVNLQTQYISNSDLY